MSNGELARLQALARIDELVAFEALPEALERLVAGGVKGKLALAVDPSATRPA